MKFLDLETLINCKPSIKNIIKNIIITKSVEFNQELINVLNLFPNIKYLEFETNNKYNFTHNDLIDELFNSNIYDIKIKFIGPLWLIKSFKAYSYQNTRIKRVWKKLCVYDFDNNFDYNSIPREINSLYINSNYQLNLTNLPINLLKIEIRSQFINPVLGYKKWKIPLNCEVYYNDKLINMDD
jgi:hypothetical protein